MDSAPEVFQCPNSTVSDDLLEVRKYMNNVLVWGTTRDEKDETLRKSLAVAESEGHMLHAEKCVFVQTEMTS